MVGRVAGSLLALLLAMLAGFYQFNLKYTLTNAGVWREVKPVGNDKCEVVKSLKACEKIVLHQPTGVLYLACSTIESRRAWTPALDRFDTSGSGGDYLATYDPKSQKVTRLVLKGLLDSRRGLIRVPADVKAFTINKGDT